MALSSMTGFARSHGASGPYAFEWELKSVNAKGFDLRMRLPPGWDELEALAKKRAGEVLSRGTVYANLNVKRANAGSTVRINVSKGSGEVTVPDVVGQTEAAAKEQLTQLNLKANVDRVPSAEPEGTVVAQNPTAGSTAQAGSLVRLNLSDGSG